VANPGFLQGGANIYEVVTSSFSEKGLSVIVIFEKRALRHRDFLRRELYVNVIFGDLPLTSSWGGGAIPIFDKFNMSKQTKFVSKGGLWHHAPP